MLEAERSKRRWLGIPIGIYALSLSVFLVAAAIILTMVNPLVGSELLVGITVLEIDTNDNERGPATPDNGDDPAEAINALKHSWNVAFCDGTPNGGTIDFIWSDVYSSEPLFCLIRAVIQNDGTEDLALEDITITGSPVLIADQPACGVVVLPAGGQAVLVFSLGVDGAALDTGGWIDGSIDLNWAVASTLVCP